MHQSSDPYQIREISSAGIVSHAKYPTVHPPRRILGRDLIRLPERLDRALPEVPKFFLAPGGNVTCPCVGTGGSTKSLKLHAPRFAHITSPAALVALHGFRMTANPSL